MAAVQGGVHALRGSGFIHGLRVGHNITLGERKKSPLAGPCADEGYGFSPDGVWKLAHGHAWAMPQGIQDLGAVSASKRKGDDCNRWAEPVV
jgi:hypothetical protein